MKNLITLILVSVLLSSCGSDENLTFQTEHYSNNSCENCAVVSVTLPVASQNKKISKTVNNSLTEEVISLLLFEEEKSIRTIPEAISSFEDGYYDLRRNFPDETIPWEARIDGEVDFENKYLVTVRLNSYIFTGGAHGYGSVQFLNFNKKNGKEIERDDLFKNRDEFEEFAEIKFREQESIPEGASINSTGFMFDRDDFYLPENIGFTEEGVKLLYNPYEVASYADGAIELTIPYNEVQEFLVF